MIDFAYIRFLILYSGKITKAYSLMNQKKGMLAKDGIFKTNIHIEEIKLLLEKSVELNQIDGSMYLLIARNRYTPHVPLTKNYHPSNIVLFLNSLKNLKRIALDVSALKFEILNIIQEKGSSSYGQNKISAIYDRIVQFMTKKHEFFTLCLTLKQLEYWGYTPL